MIWISAPSLRVLAGWAEEAVPNETGGALMGYISQDGSNLIVTDVIGPGPRARHTKTSFSPDLKYQYDAIEGIYRRSGRLHTFIGDWHTHPEGSTALSSKDRRVMRRIASHSEARAPEPVMLILGGAKGKWVASAWQLVHRTWRPVKFIGLSLNIFD